ncbi:MAG: M20/M25/M40 family metallo-hydrolase, partial [Saprospiraceae bacterium]|nr:M20/M25/M40 family metallo-hydrolase [Saprospiraceae bacterium]
DVLEAFFAKNKIKTSRVGNNVWATNKHFAEGKPTILLCSHHDTVRPATGYTRDPFDPEVYDDKLYGLGSNDAGASLASMAVTLGWFYFLEYLPFNLVFAGVAEEEISGSGGVESLLPHLPKIDCAIVGEPTGCRLAVAEKGLMVLDCTTDGRAGHAAREEGDNALYTALDDIDWLRNFQFEKMSEWLGPVKMTATSIETPNKAHNVVPDRCQFVVDVRLTDAYTPAEVLETIQQNLRATVIARSTRLRATAIDTSHPLVQAGLNLGASAYGSPTLSDKALLQVPALKTGPGESERSHTPDEYITFDELRQGIEWYIALINNAYAL